MAFRVVQMVSAQSAGTAASVTTGAITTVASGNLLVAVVVAFRNNIGASPVSDSKSNTWTAAISSTGTSKGWGAMFYVANATGGASHTFTFTPSASDYIAIAVVEIEGAATSSVLGSTASSTASGTTHTAGSITASGGVPEIFVGGGAISSLASAGAFTNGGIFATIQQRPSATAEGIVLGVAEVLAGESGSFSYTTADTQNETVMVAGFKAASAGGGGGGGSYAFAG